MARTAGSSETVAKGVDTFFYALSADSLMFTRNPDRIAVMHHLGMQVLLPAERLMPLVDLELPVERFVTTGVSLGVAISHAQLARVSLAQVVGTLRRYSQAPLHTGMLQAERWQGMGDGLVGATRMPHEPTFVTFDLAAGEILQGTSDGGINVLPSKYPPLAT